MMEDLRTEGQMCCPCFEIINETTIKKERKYCLGAAFLGSGKEDVIPVKSGKSTILDDFPGVVAERVETDFGAVASLVAAFVLVVAEVFFPFSFSSLPFPKKPRYLDASFPGL